MADYIKIFHDLYYSQPFKDVQSFNVQNCPYGDYIFNSKDCYLCFELGGSQNCLFMDNSMKCQDCVDCSLCKYSQLCSNSLHLEHCYDCHWCSYSNNCLDCYYSSELSSCQNCLGCYALKHKKYYIFNQPCSEAEYNIRRRELLAEPEKIQAELQALKNRLGYRANYIRNSYNCSGDYIINSHNCYQCFDVNNSRDSAYLRDCFYASHKEDCFDLDNAGGCELSSNSYSLGYGYNSHFCLLSTKLTNCQYCARCRSCTDCFGCVYLKDRKFYIFNQAYSEEEYYKKLIEIKAYFSERGIVDMNSVLALEQ